MTMQTENEAEALAPQESNVYVTGDKHGFFGHVFEFLNKMNTNKNDVLIILGDAGINYYKNKSEFKKKLRLDKAPITYMLVRGNHEERPSGDNFREMFICNDLFSGTFIVEKDLPSILYMIDGNIYSFKINGQEKNVLVIGGAYSVDKYYRLKMQSSGYSEYKWFPDEQLSTQEMHNIKMNLFDNEIKHVDYVLTHTCPLSKEPHEMFMSGIDQLHVDKSMENYLEDINRMIDYDKWYCGHWHTDKTDGKVRFMYNDYVLLGD